MLYLRAPSAMPGLRRPPSRPLLEDRARLAALQGGQAGELLIHCRPEHLAMFGAKPANTKPPPHRRIEAGLDRRSHTGVDKREEVAQAQAEGKIRSDIEWSVARRRSTITKMADGTVKTLTQALERVKAQIRARVEHPFHVVKNLFHYKKVRYKGLAKNKAQLYSLFGLANLVIAKKRLLDLGPQGIGAS